MDTKRYLITEIYETCEIYHKDNDMVSVWQRLAKMAQQLFSELVPNLYSVTSLKYLTVQYLCTVNSVNTWYTVKNWY